MYVFERYVVWFLKKRKNKNQKGIVFFKKTRKDIWIPLAQIDAVAYSLKIENLGEEVRIWGIQYICK